MTLPSFLPTILVRVMRHVSPQFPHAFTPRVPAPHAQLLQHGYR